MWVEHCKMLWWLSYIGKKKPPRTEQQGLGTRVHKCLEDYITLGVYPETEFEEGLIAARALHLIPMERSIQAEVRLDDLPIKMESPIPMMGIIDVLCLDGIPLVLDFKTTTSKRWIKKSYQLKDDIQLMIYAVAALVNAPMADSCDIGHCYIGKREAWAQTVQIRVSRKEVEDFFERVVITAMREMEIAGLCEPFEIERNYDFCSAYGGCKLINACEDVGVAEVFKR
tara:strand:+ start:2090 stop:2770 length:681 start_codon:yes stop_codon:yes gene_type:complete